MKIIGAYQLAALETNLITLGKETVWREVRRPHSEFHWQEKTSIFFFFFVSTSFSPCPDCTGGSEGPSHPHLTLDPDWKCHRGFAAPVTDHFHTVEGMFVFIPDKIAPLPRQQKTNVFLFSPQLGFFTRKQRGEDENHED